jgi:hypothetical protein
MGQEKTARFCPAVFYAANFPLCPKGHMTFQSASNSISTASFADKRSGAGSRNHWGLLSEGE